MVQLTRPRRYSPFARAVLVVAAAVAGFSTSVLGGQLSTEESPRPVSVPAREAWRLAESYAATNKGCEVMIGSGGSMLPLYPDRTVLIVQRRPMSELRAGMTVVFIGDRGRPVAHLLVSKTGRGWTARGLANDANDRALVRLTNYLGTVVKAFTPVLGFAADDTSADPQSFAGGD